MKPNRIRKNFQTPKVVFSPQASEGMRSGFDQLVELIRPTYGPLPHYVVLEKAVGHDNLPEFLDNGGTIARRIIQIADRDQDVGLMFLRHVLCELYERAGDGTATAALLFQCIYNLGYRLLAAGGNPMGLRQHFDNGLRLVLSELDRQTVQLYGKQMLARLAYTICRDQELAKVLGEIFDIIGVYGQLEIRKGSGDGLIREYVEGMYWHSGLRSREMANADHGLRANLETPHILISDLEIESHEQLIPLLQLSIENHIKQLILVSSTLSERASSILLAKPNREGVFVVAVKTPGVSTIAQQDALEDLAILAGGRAFLRVTGDMLENVKVSDLGRARKAWADSEYFGIIGGRGDPRTLRKHIANLRQAYRDMKTPDDRKPLQERLGRLMGGSATLIIGDYSPIAIQARLELANRTAEAMRGAMREGVVPGGGVALLGCRPALISSLNAAMSDDERVVDKILLQALEVPFRTLVANAGFDPGKILTEVENCGPGYGFDTLAQNDVNMCEAGIFDSLSVVKAAVHSAIASAALALTTETIIHRKNPPEVLNT